MTASSRSPQDQSAPLGPSNPLSRERSRPVRRPAVDPTRTHSILSSRADPVLQDVRFNDDGREPTKYSLPFGDVIYGIVRRDGPPCGMPTVRASSTFRFRAAYARALESSHLRVGTYFFGVTPLIQRILDGWA